MKKIIIDIGHPAHIHYFKNCVHILSIKGYEFLFVVRERDSTIELINELGFKYVSRGKGGKGMLNKLMLIPIIDFKIWKIAKRFKPDLFLSFSSFYAAHVAWMMRKPHIAFDDTEHAVFEHILCRPFTDVVLSPSCYYAKLSRNQILFNSYMEFCYLHPHYFTPNKNVIKEIGLGENEKYCVLRFVSWDANHDVGQHGLSLDNKKKIVEELNKYCKVFISSEQILPEELVKYKLSIHPSKLHNILFYSSLYIGEGGTTASEAAVLGTPAIYMNTLNAGLFKDERRYGLLWHTLNIDEIIAKSIEILNNPHSDYIYAERRRILIKDKIDPTAFIVWFIENYPESKKIMLENPENQERFK